MILKKTPDVETSGGFQRLLIYETKVIGGGDEQVYLVSSTIFLILYYEENYRKAMPNL